MLAVTFTLVAIPSCLPWLLAGAALRRVFRSRRASRVINVALGLLLVTPVILLVRTHR
jgi:threonine/homoserine/homoserine lactone efflux protein